MQQLRANKTDLYRLVLSRVKELEWAQLPQLRHSVFHKAYGRPSYFLEWSIQGIHYQAYFAAVAGSPLLAIEQTAEGHTEHREVFQIPLSELRERGLIEGQRDAACVSVKEQLEKASTEAARRVAELPPVNTEQKTREEVCK